MSFQEHRGAQNIWFSICFLKGIQVSASLEEQANGCDNQQQDSDEEQQEEIPFPKTENLTEIVNQLVEADAYSRRRIAQAILKHYSTAPEVNDGAIRGAQSYQDDAEITDYNNRDQSEAGNAQSAGNNITLIQNVPYLNRLQSVFQEVEQSYQRALQSDD